MIKQLITATTPLPSHDTPKTIQYTQVILDIIMFA